LERVFKMQVNSTRFGRLEVPEEKVLAFPDGLLGFEGCRRFVILEHAPDTPFKWLQCLDDPDVAFVILSPLEFLPAYGVELGRDDVAKLGLQEPDEVALYVLVVIPEEPADMTANLQGPLVLNVERRLGRQVVLADGRYQTRTPILAKFKAAQTAQKKVPIRTAPAVALAR
jgi:flagellar assembly factor FliW